jgi:hypothetical protein
MTKKPAPMSIRPSELTDDDLSKIGERIIDAVGLKLVFGEPAGLALETINQVFAASYLTVETSKKDKQKIKSMKEDAVLLEMKLSEYEQEFSFEYKNYRLNIKELISKIELNQLIHALNKFYVKNSYNLNIYLIFEPIYRKYFGIDPSYTTVDEQGPEAYQGPYWNYVSVVRAETGATNISEAAIYKARQRFWREHKGQAVT